ncbi:MAG TPA: hypothetical protein ENJ28_11265 [Gammaproteobacteria bacterium]|nr:hypothetical protein [Gammaproteobacteria bacterium]
MKYELQERREFDEEYKENIEIFRDYIEFVTRWHKKRTYNNKSAAIQALKNFRRKAKYDYLNRKVYYRLRAIK